MERTINIQNDQSNAEALNQEKGEENCCGQERSETEVLKGQIQNLSVELELPTSITQLIQDVKTNQKRLEAKMDLIFTALRLHEEPVEKEEEEEIIESPPPIQKPPEVEKEKAPEKQRLDWGDGPEEKRIKVYEIIASATQQGIPIRTTAMKKAGGKYSSAVSYSYKFFDGGWKEAKDNFNAYDGDLEKLKAMELKTAGKE